MNNLSIQAAQRSNELKEYLDLIYASAAQYDAPPIYPVTQVCGGIDGAPNRKDILGRIIAGINAYLENTNCHDTDDTSQMKQTRVAMASKLILFILWCYVHSNSINTSHKIITHGYAY